jgi:MOSC domain-containing protein YiiM
MKYCSSSYGFNSYLQFKIMISNSYCLLRSINLGRAQPLLAGGRKVLSGIGKRAVIGAVQVQRMGLVGDDVADLSVHGGLDKAVYAYPAEHYAFWQAARREHGVSLFDEALPHGFMGENLTITGLLEADVYVGDVLQFANVALRVTAPREPCFKFNAVMDFTQAAKLMVTERRCGFYLSVVTPGELTAGESYTLQPGQRKLSIADAIFGKRAKHLR